MDLSIEEILQRIPLWKGKSVIHEPLLGGITNHNYKLQVEGEMYVLRVPGSKTELFIDRENEIECSVTAGKTGLSPEVVYCLKPENIMVRRYVSGRTLHPPDVSNSRTVISRIVQSIKTIHTQARFRGSFDPFAVIRKYMILAREYSAPLPSDIGWMLSLADEIEMKMDRGRPAEAPCHNDYLSENFLDDGEKIWIIDWEYGGQGDPYFDLGDFAVEHPFTEDQERFIIEQYCGEKREERLYRMLLYKIAADLWWGLWAMIQSKISHLDFDFFGYGKNRFDRLRTNARHREYTRWLDGV